MGFKFLKYTKKKQNTTSGGQPAEHCMLNENLSDRKTKERFCKCILQYTYHDIRKVYPAFKQYISVAPFYIPQPDDLDSILELKPPLNPLPDPAFGEPQPMPPEFDP